MMNIRLPKIIFGTSALGNLYTALSFEEKKAIVNECMQYSEKLVVFDSAGKYGAGLALEMLGKSLQELNVPANEVLISNKLGWYRTDLTTAEPTFEPGVWKDLQYDAVQKISYDGIMACYEQGNQLLNSYNAQLVSVHDPDEYLATASSKNEEEKFYTNIIEAYRALFDLKKQRKVKAVGIGSKDWKVIERISKDVPFDWVMFANSFTIKEHPQALMKFMLQLHQKGTTIINSAVFNGGFLTGSSYYNYKPVSSDNDEHVHLFEWREKFYSVCKEFNVTPAAAAVQFGLSPSAVSSIALNTGNSKRVKENVLMPEIKIPREFWQRLKEDELIELKYEYL
ncbi:aldo/keto reductase [Chitinophagaceae bacterium LWZ2-11]